MHFKREGKEKKDTVTSKFGGGGKRSHTFPTGGGEEKRKGISEKRKREEGNPQPPRSWAFCHRGKYFSKEKDGLLNLFSVKGILFR